MAETSSKSKKRKWQSVALDDPSYFSGDMEGFVSLEVLEDYNIEEIKGGDGSVAIPSKKAKVQPQKEQLENVTSLKPEEHVQETKKKKKKKKKKGQSKDKQEVVEGASIEDKVEKETKSEDPVTDMSTWEALGVSSEVLRGLMDQGFTSPTPIQTFSLPPAIFHHRDIIGAAETGSGKTLAFGLPILTHILQSKAKHNTSAEDDKDHSISDLTSQAASDTAASTDEMKTPLLALIMTPTRELALQVRNHLQQAAKHTELQIVAVVGGMALQKQLRLLRKCPEVIVATPGRLWDLISEGEEHVSHLEHLSYLVIDEADRMVEQGHFQELSSILDLIHRARIDAEEPEEKQAKTKASRKGSLQKFIFSATLTLPKSFKRKGREKKLTKGETIVSLMDKVGLHKNTCKVIDVTNKKGTVETLTETKISCSIDEKDLYLYYFLSRYPGRTLVFSNTVDCVRRLGSLFRLLNFEPWVLHASMQQRQRLKNLERFTSCTSGLLLATDVAARGLDVPEVEHVIHYQVPKDPDLYIHRSGRTARANREGLSVVLVGPEELSFYKKIMKALNGGNDLDSFPVDVAFISSIRKRISLARQIDKEEHKFNRKKSSNDWILASAKAMDIEVDDDLLEDLGDTGEKKERSAKLKKMKAELSGLLKSPLLPVGFSGKYPTKTGALVVPGIKADTNCGESETVAVEDVKRTKRRKKKRIRT